MRPAAHVSTRSTVSASTIADRLASLAEKSKAIREAGSKPREGPRAKPRYVAPVVCANHDVGPTAAAAQPKDPVREPEVCAVVAGPIDVAAQPKVS